MRSICLDSVKPVSRAQESRSYLAIGNDLPKDLDVALCTKHHYYLQDAKKVSGQHERVPTGFYWVREYYKARQVAFAQV